MRPYIHNAIRREVEYKAGFYTFILNQIVAVSIWVVFWRVITRNIGDFGAAWDFPHLMVLSGFVGISNGLWFIFSYIWRVPAEILSGNLNSHLIKPVHPLAHLICKQLNLRAIPRIIMGIIIVSFAVIHFDLKYTWISIILAGVISFLSFIAVYLPLVILSISAFWLGRADFLRNLFVELFVFQNYPLTEFPNIFKYVFIVFLPLAFAGTYPALVLTKGYSTGEGAILIGILMALITCQILVFIILWSKGLRRYESYGG